MLGNYVLQPSKVQSNEEKLQRVDKLVEWINRKATGDEGFTALHFASFHGNMKSIKYLIANGANIFITNKY